MARVSYVEDGKILEEVRKLFDDVAQVSQLLGKRMPNVLKVIAHNPKALQHVAGLGAVLTGDIQLDPRYRELAVILLFRLNRSEYGHYYHVLLGRQVGLSGVETPRRGVSTKNHKNSTHFR